MRSRYTIPVVSRGTVKWTTLSYELHES